MDAFSAICAELAGGFTTADSPCIVTVTSIENSTTQTVQVQSTEPAGQPEDLLMRMSESTGRPTTDIQIGVFVLGGGLDGSKM